MSKCFVFMDPNENDLNGNILQFFCCLQTITLNKISNHKPILLFILKRIWHNWPNCGRKQQLNINTITLFWENISYYQLTNVFKMQKWTSCLWQQPKMDNYDETSRGEQSLEDMIFPEVIDPPPHPQPHALRRKAQFAQWHWQIDK